MKTSLLASVFALVTLSSPFAAEGRHDCHWSMKDMLDGTLEVVGEVESERSESVPRETCTLANQEAKPVVVALL